jgi:hypothetical protein
MKLCGWKTRAMFERYDIIEKPTSLKPSRSALRTNNGKHCYSHRPTQPAKFFSCIASAR